jgi:hypothetical protein
MDIVVVKDEHEKLRGFGEKGARAYGRFRKAVASLEIGETLAFSWHKPRSRKFHGLYFAMLGALFDQQEQFADVDQLRAWLTVGAGYCDFMPGPKGRIIALPKSIAWHRMDDNEFSELVSATWAFMRTAHATRFLWPDMSDLAADARVNNFLSEFDA